MPAELHLDMILRSFEMAKELWQRALKGQAAVAFMRDQLARKE